MEDSLFDRSISIEETKRIREIISEVLISCNKRISAGVDVWQRYEPNDNFPELTRHEHLKKLEQEILRIIVIEKNLPEESYTIDNGINGMASGSLHQYHEAIRSMIGWNFEQKVISLLDSIESVQFEKTSVKSLKPKR